MSRRKKGWFNWLKYNNTKYKIAKRTKIIHNYTNDEDDNAENNENDIAST